eukprot:jgi/Psemu1/9690/gm1.9690_g
MPIITKTAQTPKDLMLFPHVNWTQRLHQHERHSHQMSITSITLATHPSLNRVLLSPPTTTPTIPSLVATAAAPLQLHSPPTNNFPQTLPPDVTMKFDTIANEQYTFNHTHYHYHTLDQLTLLHDANITPPRKMRYVINNTFLATSFLRTLVALSTDARRPPHTHSTNGTGYSRHTDTANTATHIHASTPHAHIHADSPLATLMQTISLPHS